MGWKVVSKFMAGTFTPEIYHLFEKKLDVDRSFAIMGARARAGFKNCYFRSLGLGMMFIGFNLIFTPFIRLLIRLPLLVSVGSLSALVVSTIITLSSVFFINGCAWFVYRPWLSCLYVACAFSMAFCLAYPHAVEHAVEEESVALARAVNNTISNATG